VHPRVLGATSNLPAPMALTFVVSLAGIALLYTTLFRYELTAKHARAQLRTLRRRLAGDDALVSAQRRGRSAAPTALQPAAMMTARGAGRDGL
jgi:heme exporter protein C